MASDTASFPSLGHHGEKHSEIKVFESESEKAAVQLCTSEGHPVQNVIKGALKKLSIF